LAAALHLNALPSTAPPERPQAVDAGLAVNGWTLFADPIFLDQLDALTAQVEGERPTIPRDLTSSRQ
jgi:hypothetical protein